MYQTAVRDSYLATKVNILRTKMLGKPKAVHAQDGARLVYQTCSVYIEFLAENEEP